MDTHHELNNYAVCVCVDGFTVCRMFSYFLDIPFGCFSRRVFYSLEIVDAPELVTVTVFIFHDYFCLKPTTLKLVALFIDNVRRRRQ